MWNKFFKKKVEQAKTVVVESLKDETKRFKLIGAVVGAIAFIVGLFVKAPTAQVAKAAVPIVNNYIYVK